MQPLFSAYNGSQKRIAPYTTGRRTTNSTPPCLFYLNEDFRQTAQSLDFTGLLTDVENG